MYQLVDGKKLHINPYDWTEYKVLFEPQVITRNFKLYFYITKNSKII